MTPKETRPPRQEFERKFLVIASKLPEDLPPPKEIVQGYLHFESPYVRIRVINGVTAILEIKARNHFESKAMPMDLDEARYLLDRERKGALVEKHRHDLPSAFDGMKWEIDRFIGQNAPLIVAEIETPAKDTPLDPAKFPDFIGREVSDDPRFKNRNLAQRPFQSWDESEQLSILKEMGF